LLLWLAVTIFAPANAADIEELLARPEAPEGVVFEIVDADETSLRLRLPAVRSAIERIRERFPHTRFAVVSHGLEEFALQSRYREEHADIHDQVRRLAAGEVPVHVCETHAGWYGVAAEDFPDYVDVAPSGPVQISLYQELGYELIVVR
jgi:intracellular sulfur oxidation DsrE/DsrF family protein